MRKIYIGMFFFLNILASKHIQAQEDLPLFNENKRTPSFVDFMVDYLRSNFQKEILGICIENDFAVAFKFDQNKKISDIRFSESTFDTLKTMVKKALIESQTYWTVPDRYIGKNFIFFMNIDWEAACYMDKKKVMLERTINQFDFDDNTYLHGEDCFFIGFSVSVSSYGDIRRRQLGREMEEAEKNKKK